MAFGFGLALAHGYKRAGGGVVLAPTLNFDFRTAGALDPLITFTRSGTATYIDSTGAVADAAANAPRFDYDPATLILRGLLLEGSTTNRVLRSEVTGATPGIIGSGGVMPTGWTQSGWAGLVIEVIGTGTVNGLTYLDFRASGTASGTFGAIQFSNITGLVTATPYTASFYVQRIAGSNISGASTNVALRYNLSPSGTTDISTPAFVMQGSVPLLQQRVSVTGTTTGTLTGSGTTFFLYNYPASSVVDITFRIAAPQVEQAPFASSYIKTTGSTVTRSSDSALVSGANFTSIWNAVNGTLAGEWTNYAVHDAITTNAVCSADDTTANERVQLRRAAGAGFPSGIMVDGGAVQLSNAGALAVAPYVVTRAAVAYKLNDSQFASAGVAQTADAACTIPTPTLIQLGAGGGIAGLAGHLRRFLYFNTRLTEAQLQAITA